MCYSGFYLFILSGSEGRWKKFEVKFRKGFQKKKTPPTPPPSATDQTKKRASVEEGELAVGVTPGFLSSICCSHFTVTAIYLYSAVMFGISSRGSGGWRGAAIVFLGTRWEPTCQRLPAPFCRSVLFIADKHSLVGSSRDRGGAAAAAGEALVIRVRSRRRVD